MSSDEPGSPLDGSDTVAPWDIEREETVAETRIFELRRRLMAERAPRGKRGEFVYLDSVDWVNVVAITPDERVVLVEQYRHGARSVTLEIPGGMVDAGESPEKAALRELREETGYAGTSAGLIGRVSPNPAIMNNWCHTVLVRDARRVGEQEEDGTERIVVRTAPLADVPELIRRGAIHHALVVAAFHHLHVAG